MLGTLLNNRYRIDTELGRGGMSVVYRAHDLLLGRVVAVKVLNDSDLGTQGRTRLLREAQAAANLNHPNIVSVYDAGEVAGSPFIVMELIEGQTLQQYRPASLDETLLIIRQTCAALEHAHGKGIVHRDIKPENVVTLPSPTRSASSETRSQGEGPGGEGQAHGLRLSTHDRRFALDSGRHNGNISSCHFTSRTAGTHVSSMGTSWTTGSAVRSCTTCSINSAKTAGS